MTTPYGTGRMARRADLAFRDLVSTALTGTGYLAEARTWRSGDGDGEHDPGEIVGLPGWTITTTTAGLSKLSRHADRSRVLSRRTGTRGALVVRRENAPAGRHYVVLNLEDFARIARATGH